MFWLILLIVVAALCALVLFLVAPAAGRKELRTPFAGRNFAHRGYFGKISARRKTACPPLPPPCKTDTAWRWMCSSAATVSCWCSMMIP